MDKQWFKKFQKRVQKTLKSTKRIEAIADFDEDTSQSNYKLVSITLINLVGKKKRGSKPPPVHGNALYYVYHYGDDVKLLHPTLLETYVTSRREFDKGVTDVWWPNEAAKENPEAKNKFGLFCNRFKVAATMEARLRDFAQREKLNKKQQEIVRNAIADLREVPLDQVPKFKIPEKENALKAWKENQAKVEYRKRATEDLKRYNDEKETKVSSKNKKKSKKSSGSSSSNSASASASASSDANDKKKKSSKKHKDEKKSSSKKSKSKSEKPKAKPGEVKAPRGKKTAVGVCLRLLLKKKGKKLSYKDLAAEVTKAKGMKRGFSEKKIQAKTKAMAKWAEKNGLSLKASSSGIVLK